MTKHEKGNMHSERCSTLLMRSITHAQASCISNGTPPALRLKNPGLAFHGREVDVRFTRSAFEILGELHNSADTVHLTKVRQGSPGRWRDALDNDAEERVGGMRQGCLRRDPPFSPGQLAYPVGVQISPRRTRA